MNYLSTSLPNLFTEYKCFTKLQKIPQETLFGVYNNRKVERKSWGFETPLNRLRVEIFLCPFGQQISFKPALPVKNQRTILRCKSHEIQKKSAVTILVQHLQFLHKKGNFLNVISNRNIKFRGLKTEFWAT